MLFSGSSTNQTVTLKEWKSVIFVICNLVSYPAGGAEAFPDVIEEGHLSDDEGEGGNESDKKKKKLKKKKKVTWS